MSIKETTLQTVLKVTPILIAAFATYKYYTQSVPEENKNQLDSGWDKGHVTKSGLVKKRYRCELCGIDITNKKNLDMHNKGKKHLERIQ